MKNNAPLAHRLTLSLGLLLEAEQLYLFLLITCLASSSRRLFFRSNYRSLT
jgi:hypothetical protein